MTSFDEYAKLVPNPSLQGFVDSLKKQIEEELEAELESFRKDGIIGEVDKEKVEKRINTCPHCNRPIQPQDAVPVTTYRRSFVGSHTTYLPAGGRRTRSEYIRC